MMKTIIDTNDVDWAAARYSNAVHTGNTTVDRLLYTAEIRAKTIAKSIVKQELDKLKEEFIKNELDKLKQELRQELNNGGISLE